MIRTYKRKLKPTKEQQERLLRWVGVCRMVYNMGLEIRIAAWKTKQQSVGKYDLQKQITEIRKEYSWIADVPYDALANVTDRLEKAYKGFFIGHGFPKWASKKTFRSIALRNNFLYSGNKIRLQKLGWVKMFNDKPINGEIKTAQIVIKPTGLFICIQCELPDPPPRSENQAIGVDMGIAKFAVLSDGTMVENPRHFKKYERKLRIENRSLARKKKGSNSWERQCKKLSRLHHAIGNVRQDFLHKESSKIANAYSLVFVEDLNIRGMVKNRRFSKHISDAGWGGFRRMLTYKTTAIAVNPRYTSQTCNVCGTVDAVSRKSQSEFECTSCGHISHADINAAKNILERGHRLLAQSTEDTLRLANVISNDMSAIQEPLKSQP